MLIYYGIKFVGILMSMFGPNYATFAVGRFIVATSVGYAIAGYVLGKNTVNTRSLGKVTATFDMSVGADPVSQPAVARALTRYRHIETAEQRIIQQYSDW